MRLEVIAHRGATDEFPENTVAAFERAIDLGADGTELDVRLTSDGVPVVFHQFYLDDASSGRGPVASHSLAALRRVVVTTPTTAGSHRIPTLEEVLGSLAGRTTLEIEIKGPEAEAANVVAAVLSNFRDQWATVEVTCYEPALLLTIAARCDVAVDLLTHRSEPWMKEDYVVYSSVHRARLSGARAVHLHPTQLSEEVVGRIRDAGVDVHSYGVNDKATLALMSDLGIPRFTTDRLAEVLNWRRDLAREPAV